MAGNPGRPRKDGKPPKKRKRPKKVPLTRAQKTALRQTLTYWEAEAAAYDYAALKRMKSAAGIKSREARAARRLAKQALANDWQGQLARNPTWQPRAQAIKRTRGYDMIGFLEYILGGNVEIPLRQSSGEGRSGYGPLVPRAWQLKILQELVEHRLSGRTRWLEAVIKGRQRGYSVLWDSFIWADATCNNGTQSIISAHRIDTLKSLNQNLRTFAGRRKDAGKAHRMADAIIETPGGSTIELRGAGDSLGRGGSLTHVHVSEADYEDNLDDTLDSVLASMHKGPEATGVLESTIRRGSNTEFKDFIEETLKDQERRARRDGGVIDWMEDDWRVRFLSWTSDETAVITLNGTESAAFMDSIESADNRAREYERALRDEHKCTPGQIAWWRMAWRQDARRNLDRMLEMYPTTLQEALDLVSSSAFFTKDALDFYRGMCREPVERYRVGYDGMMVVESGASGALMDLWHQPNGRYTYVIGADSADADTRLADKGSECYAVVLEIETGRQVAELHGYLNTHEFGMALWRMAMWYNDALLVPEVPVGGGGVVDSLVNQFGYTKIYEREEQRDGTWQTVNGKFGFDTKAGSRTRIVGRMQDNLNGKQLAIYSHYLLDQLVAFGKRGGRPQKKQQKAGQIPDDGCMALSLCMVGHDNAVNGAWLPKDAEEIVDNPRGGLLYGERAERARESLVVGPMDDLAVMKWRQAQERDIMEALICDG